MELTQNNLQALLHAIYSAPIPKAPIKRSTMNCSKVCVKPKIQVAIEKNVTECAMVLTRPNLSQAQPPKIPPIPIPAKDALPNAPA